MLRLKSVNNSFFWDIKVINTIFEAINGLKIINLKTKKTSKLRKLLIILTLIVLATIASHQASLIKLSQFWVHQPEKIFAVIVE